LLEDVDNIISDFKHKGNTEIIEKG